ncbi:hypothetical protein H2200_007719 [Cladophialophora chaetospira]|uniref:Fumarylacetoacetase-like C-terminal domain-containing protein n=1 Tax=Cladophialophora chaetospira TaxID=386627 RepID=A0AA38X6E1_9EURO|nr:hypothetical protein H2200_007719 [Cladophialophora chaetospira]
MPRPSVFRRLVRFQNAGGETRYGELPPDAATEDTLTGVEVDVYDGDEPWSLVETSEKDTIKQRVPIYICVGMNYKSHIEETKFPVPQYPILFNKPSAALAGPEEDIAVHPKATLMDYEVWTYQLRDLLRARVSDPPVQGELCVIIGKDCKDLTEEDDIEDFVLGYTVGNDVTSRFWQLKPQSGDQAGYSKSFDKFAPIGPIICSPSQIPDPSQLTLATWVNGEERQRSKISDLLFSVKELIKFCSVGHTIERGTVIMTGTPSGVGALMEPSAWLKHGDVVEVNIDGIGTLKNRIVVQ